MSSILIISTYYDATTYYTRNWALDLQEKLVVAGHDAFIMRPEHDCRQGQAFQEALDRCGYVVYYGHGINDSWIALPNVLGAGQISIVDSNYVLHLANKGIYALCCDSLNGLGRAIASMNNGYYVGYIGKFQFEHSNNEYFSDVANAAVLDFVRGRTASQVEVNLRLGWEALKNDFLTGRYSTNINAVMAANCADANSQRIGSA